MGYDVRFIGVPELLTSIGAGIGLASRSIVEKSLTEWNVLAMQKADVAITFEMTSSTTQASDDNGVSFLGAKTLSFTTDTESKQDTFSNRCNINMSIVSVARAAVQNDQVLNVLDLGFLPTDVDGLKTIVNAAKKQVGLAAATPGQKQEMTTQLSGVELLLKSKQPEEARVKMAEFLTQFAGKKV